MSTVMKKIRTAAKTKQVTLRTGRWFTTTGGKLVKVLSTRGVGARFPVIAGLYNPKTMRLVNIENFSPKGIVKGGIKTSPLNIVASAKAPNEFTSLEKNFIYDINI